MNEFWSAFLATFQKIPEALGVASATILIFFGLWLSAVITIGVLWAIVNIVRYVYDFANYK